LSAGNVEMVLRIELEKGRELLMRERKLSGLKIADLEEQLEQMRQEAAVRQESAENTMRESGEQHRNAIGGSSPLQSENVDPFAEARNRLAAMTSTTALKPTTAMTLTTALKPTSHPIQQSVRPGAPPPSECLQQ
jgi:hypothetical protein